MPRKSQNDRKICQAALKSADRERARWSST
jgi:hypothetical protein